MDGKTLETPNITPDQNTPCDSGKIGTPDHLKVPKAFKYPERYTSPTDQMMSPVTRGIIARRKKGSKLLPPSVANDRSEPSKIQVQEPGLVPSVELLSLIYVKNL